MRDLHVLPGFVQLQGKALEPEVDRPQRQPREKRTEGSKKGKSRKKRKKLPSKPREVSPKAQMLVDSAGHDEVIYVGSIGDLPQPATSVGTSVKEVLDTQQAMLAEAEAAAAKKAQLSALLGEEEAARYLAFKQQEAQKRKPPSKTGQEPGESSKPIEIESKAQEPTTILKSPPKRKYFLLSKGKGRSMSNLTPVRPGLRGVMGSRMQAVQPMIVVPPAVRHEVGYWDTLGAFHDRWNGVYFKGYYFPQGGHAPYRRDGPIWNGN